MTTPGDRWRPAVALLLALAGLLALVLVVWPARARLGTWIEAAQDLHPAWVFAIAGLYLPFCALLLPGTWVTIFCCLVFGFWPTFPAIVLASNLGAALAFVLGRTLLRARVHAWVRARPRLAAVETAIGAESFRLVFLLRLTPLVPFNALNYALGVTPIRLAPYALGTFLGMLPGTALNCWTLASVKELAPVLAGDLPPDPLGVAGLVARRARAALRGTV